LNIGTFNPLPAFPGTPKEHIGWSVDIKGDDGDEAAKQQELPPVIITVTQKITVIEVFKLLFIKKISAVPVVDDDGMVY
jgi:CBS domain-containing protein